MAPPSTETSTAPTFPPTSEAVPLTVTRLPAAIAPPLGCVIVEVGSVVSVD